MPRKGVAALTGVGSRDEDGSMPRCCLGERSRLLEPAFRCSTGVSRNGLGEDPPTATTRCSGAR